MAKRKILTVTLEFEIGNQKIFGERVKATHDAVVVAAAKTAEEELPDGSLEAVRSRATWDYRWYETTSNRAESDDWDEADIEDIDD